jgi:RNA polymerase sigma factor (sigma-70 family)
MVEPYVRVFAERRPMLLGLAYRMLGSRADAEDAVQDTFLKWSNADRSGIDNPAAWLTTACTRRCIDLLRSAHKTRVDYVGAWLPEPIHVPSTDMSDETPALASSLTTAFLLMLERLTPKERAAYLLHEIFEQSYPEIAQALGLQEPAVRQHVSRARRNIEHAKVRHVTPADQQERLLAAFQDAVTSGSTGTLATLLSDEIALAADGGGRVAAIREVLHGPAAVLAFVDKLHRWWDGLRWTAVEINGTRGAVITRDGATIASVSFALDEAGRATGIYIMRNPDKLSGLAASVS